LLRGRSGQKTRAGGGENSRSAVRCQQSQVDQQRHDKGKQRCGIVTFARTQTLDKHPQAGFAKQAVTAQWQRLFGAGEQHNRRGVQSGRHWSDRRDAMLVECERLRQPSAHLGRHQKAWWMKGRGRTRQQPPQQYQLLGDGVWLEIAGDLAPGTSGAESSRQIVR
jgi:hypothetical protein